jgi:hypothetical protein
VLLALGLIQLALLVVGRQFTHYAAFAAARAALVADVPGAGERIDPKTAARLAALPAVGTGWDMEEGTSFPSVGEALPLSAAGRDLLYGRFGRWPNLPARWRASADKIEVELSGRGPEVSASVVHRFELVVPVAGRALAALWRFASWDDLFSFGAPHIPIRERVVLSAPWREDQPGQG